MLVTMATWEFIWRESCDWRLSHCKRLVEIKKKKARLAENEITFYVSRKYQETRSRERSVHGSEHCAGLSRGWEMCLRGPNAAASLSLLFTCTTW